MRYRVKSNNYVQIEDYYPKLRCPEKYVGKRPLTVRSSYEIKYFKWCDANKSVLEWSSESIIIPYRYSVDKRMHRYYPDAWIKVVDKKGDIREYLVEIKPYKQTFPPKPQKRQTKAYIQRCRTYIKNRNKWDAAEEYCRRMRAKGEDLTFKLVTERELGIKN